MWNAASAGVFVQGQGQIWGDVWLDDSACGEGGMKARRRMADARVETAVGDKRQTQLGRKSTRWRGYGRRCNARVTRPDKNHHGQKCTRKRRREKCQNGDISDGKKDGCAKLGHVRMGPMTELPDPPCSSTVRMGQVLATVEFSVQEAKVYGACKPVAWRREGGSMVL